MAHSNELAAWLLQNADALDLRATSFTWPSEWGLIAHFDYEVSIDLRGIRYAGRATARGEELAFIKAGAEALERAYCAGHDLKSNGVAAHVNEADAILHARREALERDAFYCHYLTKTAFTPIDSAAFARLTSMYPLIFAKLDEFGVSLRFYDMRTIGEASIVCVAEGLHSSSPWGGVIGLSSKTDFFDAAESALLECLRNTVMTIADPARETLSLSEFKALSQVGPHDRRKLALDLDFWRTVAPLFPSLRADVIEADHPRPPDAEFIVKKLACPFSEIERAPIVVCRATLSASSSHRSHDNSTGNHPDRLSKFLGRPIRASDQQTMPDFLG